MSLNENEPPYCIECSGTPHAPWCSQYIQPEPYQKQRAFDHAWDTAPRFYTNTGDRDDAEYWYEIGRRQGRMDQAQTMSDDLREIARVVRERLQ